MAQNWLKTRSFSWDSPPYLSHTPRLMDGNFGPRDRKLSFTRMEILFLGTENFPALGWKKNQSINQSWNSPTHAHTYTHRTVVFARVSQFFFVFFDHNLGAHAKLRLMLTDERYSKDSAQIFFWKKGALTFVTHQMNITLFNNLAAVAECMIKGG